MSIAVVHAEIDRIYNHIRTIPVQIIPEACRWSICISCVSYGSYVLTFPSGIDAAAAFECRSRPR